MDAAMIKATAQPLDTGAGEEAEDPGAPVDQGVRPDELIGSAEDEVWELEKGETAEELPETEMLALPEAQEEIDQEPDSIDLEELDELDEMMDELVALDGIDDDEGLP